jgi:hypothetical protein
MPHIEALIQEDLRNYLGLTQPIQAKDGEITYIARSPDGFEMMPYSSIFSVSIDDRVHGRATVTRYDLDNSFPTDQTSTWDSHTNIERTSWGWNKGKNYCKEWDGMG